MNIILLDKENVKEINDIEVIEDTKLYIVNLDSNYKVNINLLDNTKLEVFDFNLSNKSVEFVINQNNNTSFIYNHSFKINGDYNLNMVANILGDDNTNKINIYCISNVGLGRALSLPATDLMTSYSVSIICCFCCLLTIFWTVFRRIFKR